MMNGCQPAASKVAHVLGISPELSAKELLARQDSVGSHWGYNSDRAPVQMPAAVVNP